MYSVIGLCTVGCNVAKCFDEYPQYEVFCVDDQAMDWKNKLVIKKQQNPEAYEENFKAIPKSIKDKIKANIIVVLSGSSFVSSIVLKFLYQLRDKNISIICIRPELDLLTDTKIMHEKMIYSVLQEYTRSGIFKNIYLTSNTAMDKMIENASIKEYYPAMNKLIASAFHMIKVFDHQEPEVSNFSDINHARRVCTLGIMDLDSGNESLFSEFENPMDMRLYYGISKSTLNTDKNLQRSIIKTIKNKNQELCKYSYGVYETQYESDFCYIKTFSSKVQEF